MSRLSRIRENFSQQMKYSNSDWRATFQEDGILGLCVLSEQYA